MKIKLSILGFLLAGCGSDFTPAGTITDPSQQPLTLIQAVNLDSNHVSEALWVGEIEHANHQLQNEFRSEWDLNVLLVETTSAQYNSTRPALLGVSFLPDPIRDANGTQGYHIGNIGYSKTTLPGWRITDSHESMEMSTDEAINSIGSKLATDFLGAKVLEICDAVFIYGYDNDPTSGLPTVSDFVTKAWYGIGPVKFVNGKPSYDFLQKLQSAGQSVPGGT